MFWVIALLVYMASIFVTTLLWTKTKLFDDYRDSYDYLPLMSMSLFFAPLFLLFLPFYALYKLILRHKKKKNKDKEHKEYIKGYKKRLMKSLKYSTYATRIYLYRENRENNVKVYACPNCRSTSCSGTICM